MTDRVELLLVALITEMPALLTATGGLLVILAKIREVHVMVNQQRTDMMAKIESLEKIISDKRVEEAERKD